MEILNNTDKLFLVAVGIATYIYAAFSLRKTPDPSTQHGMSLNAMMAGLMAIGAVIFALFTILITGPAGYFISSILIVLAIHFIVKNLTTPKDVV